MLKCFILTKYRLCQSSLLQTTKLLIHIFQSSNHYLFGVLILVSSPLSHLFQFFHIFFNSCHWCSKFCTHNCKVTDGCLLLTLFNFFLHIFRWETPKDSGFGWPTFLLLASMRQAGTTVTTKTTQHILVTKFPFWLASHGSDSWEYDKGSVVLRGCFFGVINHAKKEMTNITTPSINLSEKKKSKFTFSRRNFTNICVAVSVVCC